MPPTATPNGRSVIAMKYGDCCWLRGLQTRPDLDGLMVVLIEWVDDRQRWRCKPEGWKHTDEFIAVKPKNLTNEPVPRWALLANEGVKIKDHKVTPKNSHVACVNHKDFANCQMPVPPAPTWDVVRSRLVKNALACRDAANSARVPGNGESRSNDDEMAAQVEKLKIGLGKQVREHAGEDVEPGAYYAARLESLIKREGELRQVAIDAGADTGGYVSIENTLRHMLAQEALIEAQISLFALRDQPALLEQAAKMLHEHFAHLEPLRKQWEEAGNPELDFWEDSEYDPEVDPELRKIEEEHAKARGSTKSLDQCRAQQAELEAWAKANGLSPPTSLCINTDGGPSTVIHPGGKERKTGPR